MAAKRRMRGAGLMAAAMALLLAGAAQAKDALPHVKVAVGGAGCLCYLPTMLAQQIGAYEKAGVEVELINFKGGSTALTAVLGGSADVVSGYYDHYVNLAAKDKALTAFVTYDRVPGLVLVVSPKDDRPDQSVKDLAGKKVGCQRAGLLDRFLPEISAAQERHRSQQGAGHRRRPRRHRGRRDGAGPGRRRGHARSRGDRAARQVITELRILADTRTAGRHADAVRRRVSRRRALCADRLGREAPEGDAGARRRDGRDAAMDPRPQRRGDHGQDAEGDGRARQGALSRRAQEHDPDVLDDRHDGSEGRAGGARRVQPVVPEIAEAHIDLSKTYTNAFAEKADAKLGVTQ